MNDKRVHVFAHPKNRQVVFFCLLVLGWLNSLQAQADRRFFLMSEIEEVFEVDFISSDRLRDVSFISEDPTRLQVVNYGWEGSSDNADGTVTSRFSVFVRVLQAPNNNDPNQPPESVIVRVKCPGPSSGPCPEGIEVFLSKYRMTLSVGAPFNPEPLRTSTSPNRLYVFEKNTARGFALPQEWDGDEEQWKDLPADKFLTIEWSIIETDLGQAVLGLQGLNIRREESFVDLAISPGREPLFFEDLGYTTTLIDDGIRRADVLTNDASQAVIGIHVPGTRGDAFELKAKIKGTLIERSLKYQTWGLIPINRFVQMESVNESILSAWDSHIDSITEAFAEVYIEILTPNRDIIVKRDPFDVEYLLLWNSPSLPQGAPAATANAGRWVRDAGLSSLPSAVIGVRNMEPPPAMNGGLTDPAETTVFVPLNFNFASNTREIVFIHELAHLSKLFVARDIFSPNDNSDHSPGPGGVMWPVLNLNQISNRFSNREKRILRAILP